MRCRGTPRHPLCCDQDTGSCSRKIRRELSRVVESWRRHSVCRVCRSVIQDGKVVFEGGFGVREIGTDTEPDADTLYIIASNTKALTTLMLAKLLDEGKLTWDTPVTSLLPSFKLGDPDITSRVLVKHLICACTGLPQGVGTSRRSSLGSPRAAQRRCRTSALRRRGARRQPRGYPSVLPAPAYSAFISRVSVSSHP